MSVKSVFKKKLLKIKNPINSMKKKSKKNKLVISAPSEEMNIKSNHLDKVKDKTTITEISLKHEHLHETNIVQKKITETIKIGNKRKSIDNKTNDEQPKKKKVTFSADVKSEKDQKCTAGNMKPLSLNKRKKKNYIKKLKAKKNKQKNAKKCEENASAISTPRQERAIEYLMQWKNDRSNWKFKKIYQLWLIKNTYDSTKASILCLIKLHHTNS